MGVIPGEFSTANFTAGEESVLGATSESKALAENN